MTKLEPHLVPPGVRGHISVAKLHKYWYVACRSVELKRQPLRRLVLGTPLVLFRNGRGEVGALLDRCPHRNVPLSEGRVAGSGNLECCYHGWQFDCSGACTLVPGLIDDKGKAKRRVERYLVREQQGLIWVYMDPDAESADEGPYTLPHFEDARFTSMARMVEAEASVHATAENALDVPHTAYLHKGLFRGGDKNRIDVVVRRWHDRVEAEYLGEPRPPGLVGKLLSPSGGIVEHWDRFLMPSIAQVEYKIGEENHILVTSCMTPETDFKTRLYAVVSIRSRVPGKLIQPVLEPLAKRIFQQDADILKLQTETIHRFGGEQYMSTEIDVLGRDIWRLMKHAESGSQPAPSDEPVVRELQFLA